MTEPDSMARWSLRWRRPSGWRSNALQHASGDFFQMWFFVLVNGTVSARDLHPVYDSEE
jgi:hypothetical protein